YLGEYRCQRSSEGGIFSRWSRSRRPRGAPIWERSGEGPGEGATLPADAAVVQGQPVRQGPPVVGIGASAGGLEALTVATLNLSGGRKGSTIVSTYICPHCGDPLTESEIAGNRCFQCHKTLPLTLAELQARPLSPAPPAALAKQAIQDGEGVIQPLPTSGK